VFSNARISKKKKKKKKKKIEREQEGRKENGTPFDFNPTTQNEKKIF
jgi:hypothetical protein